MQKYFDTRKKSLGLSIVLENDSLQRPQLSSRWLAHLHLTEFLIVG